MWLFQWGRLLSAAVTAFLVGAVIGLRPFEVSAPLLAATVAGALAIPLAITRPELFVFAGLVFLSSDTFLATDIGPLTLKPSHILFGYAVVGTAVNRLWRKQPPVFREVPRPLILVTVALITLYVVATVLSPRPDVGARKLLVIAGGSVLPAVALLATITTTLTALKAMRFLIMGQFIVGLYALYEFSATYVGFPTVAPYFGPLGSVSRATALSFEPGYYSAYIVTALPLIFLDIARHQKRLWPIVSPMLIGFVVLLALLLSNARAALISLPLIVIGFYVTTSKGKSAVNGSRRKTRVLVTLLLTILVMIVGARAAGFDLVRFARERVVSITDPTELSSNAPRLGLYRAVATIIEDNPKKGVGPGMLGYVLPKYGIPIPSSKEHIATANNIWLEVMVEVGLAGFPLVALLLLMTLHLVLRRSPVETRMLALGALIFLLVHGAVVSFLWDMKYWVVLALALAAHRLLPSSGESRFHFLPVVRMHVPGLPHSPRALPATNTGPEAPVILSRESTMETRSTPPC